jgi:hypothetical protein
VRREGHLTTKPKVLLFSDADGSWESAARFANVILRAGRRVWWAQEPVRARHGDGSLREYPSGSFVVSPQRGRISTAAENPLGVPDAKIFEEARRRKVKVHTVEVVYEVRVRSLRYPRIALFAEAGTPYAFATVLASGGFEYHPLNAVDIRNDRLKDFDVLMLPGGAHRGGELQGELMGEIGRAKVKEFVHRGGAVWGSCGGCYNLIYVAKSKGSYWKTAFKQRNEKSFTINWTKRPSFHSLELLNAEYWSLGMAGVGTLVMKNVNPDHPVLFGMPSEFEMAWQLGPFLDTTGSRVNEASAPMPLLRLGKLTQDYTSAEHLYDPQSSTGTPESEGEETYTARGMRDQVLGMVAGYYGEGRVAGSGGHPELGLDWLYERRGQAARIISNFIFWSTSQEIPEGGEGPGHRIEAGLPALLGREHLHKILVDRLPSLNESISVLVSKGVDIPAFWNAEASFGLSAAEKWPKLLKRVQQLPSEIRRASASLQHEYRRLYEVHEKLLTMRKREPTYQRLAAIDTMLSQTSEMLAKLVEDYTYKRAPEWEQDYGWQGVLALLDSAHDKIRAAAENFHDPKAVGFDSPHSLMWGWYLGAVHDLINAKTVLNGRATLVGDLLKAAEISIGGL